MMMREKIQMMHKGRTGSLSSTEIAEKSIILTELEQRINSHSGKSNDYFLSPFKEICQRRTCHVKLLIGSSLM